MKNTYTKILVLFLVLQLSCNESSITNPSDDITSIPLLEIEIDSEDLIRLRNNRTNSLKVPVKAAFKNQLHFGEIRASGAGSRYHPKWSYQITLNDGRSINGLTKFNLSAQVFDPTLLHTKIATYFYKQLGFPLFETEYVFLRLNGNDEGLYPLIERIEQPFFEKRNIGVYQLFKLGFDSKFTFEDDNYPEFHFEKKIPDDKNFTQLYELINAIDTSNAVNIFETLGPHLNIKQYIKYHAITTLMNSFDAFTNNFFLHKKTPTSSFEIIPWDFDKIFQEENISKLAGKNAIIKKLFTNDSTFNMYKRELENQLQNLFTEENIFPIINNEADKIEEAYNLDPYLGKGGRYNFLTEIKNLKSYIKNRISYFDNNIVFLSQDYFNFE